MVYTYAIPTIRQLHSAYAAQLRCHKLACIGAIPAHAHRKALAKYNAIFAARKAAGLHTWCK